MRIRLLRSSLFLSIAALAPPLSGQARWAVPGVILASGLNGTHFVSDVTATNPGTTPANVTVTLLPAQGSTSQAVSLAPGQTVVYRNVIGGLFGLSGAVGALTVDSDQPLLLRARTYNDAGPGTYGVALPVVAEDRLLSAGDQADTFWISQDAAADSGYRTNVAVAFPDGGGSATVTVFDANGQQVGEHVFSVNSAGFQQVSVGSFAGAVPLGRATVQVTSGRATAYAVVADNVTGDTSLFTFDALPAGIQDVIVNGVARVNGRNATYFRTDARFYNPTDTEATVTVGFHALANSNVSPLTRSFTIPAGSVIAVVDVLDGLLGLPVGSTGALRFRSQWPIAILCRTSNVDPTGVKPGTFGTQQVPVPLFSFLTSADPGAAVTGIRQNTAFRTNVGFAAGADGATCTLTLEGSAGNSVAATSLSLGAFGWTQVNVQDLFPGITIPEDATLAVRVTQGSVDVYDTSTDNVSGDSVLTPIAPLPAAIASSATIGPAGGSLRSDDGRLTLRIPAGALSAPVAFSFQPGTNDATLGVGAAYQLNPTNVPFSRPALLTLAYGPDDVASSAADALSLVANDGSGWVVAGGGSVDASRRTLTVLVSSGSPPHSAPGGALQARAAPGTTTWAAATSWALAPRGRFAILVGGQALFRVESTGPSSSTVPTSFALSRSPSDVSVSWLVNGQIGGNIIDGTITREGFLGSYQAAACPPPRNPVTISANISNNGTFSVPYRVKSFARVRVLHRNWTFTNTWDQVFSCPGAFAADRVKYRAGFSFSLDDNLNVTNVSEFSVTREFPVSPAACDPSDVDLARIGDPYLRVSLESGIYDKDRDKFHLVFDWVFPSTLGYDYKFRDSNGRETPQVFPAGPSVPVPGFHFFLEESDFLWPAPTGAAHVDWEWNLEHVRASPCQ
jgi:hypothetical protein